MDRLDTHKQSHDPTGDMCPPKAMPPESVMRNAPLHRVLRGVEHAFRQQALAQLRAEGIDIFPGVAPLILHLGDEDGLTMTELGKRCGLDSSTLTPLVDLLERHKLAVRARAFEDRRVYRLHLTEQGKTLEPRLRSLLVRLQTIAFAGIPEEEMQAMLGTLERIAGNLNSFGSET